MKDTHIFKWFDKRPMSMTCLEEKFTIIEVFYSFLVSHVSQYSRGRDPFSPMKLKKKLVSRLVLS